MGFAEAIGTCLRKYVTFSGRASRSEYWWFFLFVFTMGALASVVDNLVFPAPDIGDDGSVPSPQPQPMQTLVSLGLFLPHLAAAFRRMHDTGRSGWFVFLPTALFLTAIGVLIFGIGIANVFASGGSMDILFTRVTLLLLIPTLVVLLISPLLVLFWLTRPGSPDTNAYGPAPQRQVQ